MRKKYNTRFNRRIQIDTPYLLEPPHLSLQIANDDQINRLYKAVEYMSTQVDNLSYKQFDSTELSKFQRVAKWAEDNRYSQDLLPTLRKDFVSFVDEHDKRRGTNFLSTFPEMESIYNQWKVTD